MEITLILTSSVAGISAIFLTVLGWSHWRLMRYVASMEDRLANESTPAQIAECETYVKAFGARIDTYSVENETFRNAVHKSMQRFDAIMRRNEQSLIDRAEKVVDKKTPDDYPDEIRLGEHHPPQAATGRLTKAELRDLARKAGKL